MIERVEVAVVGGGLAGAAVAARLARAGREVLVLERQRTWRWRACGVFSSPAALVELRSLGLDEPTLQRAARRLPAMRVETPAGTSFRLTYGNDGSGRATPVGFDRSVLDAALLALSESAGAQIRRGSAVVSVEVGHGSRNGHPGLIRASDGSTTAARIVIGADGIRSVVARDLGVARRSRLSPRVGLTYHLDGGEGSAQDARMILLEDGYCGIAPVPGDRVNVGIVLAGKRWRRELGRAGGAATTAGIVAHLPSARAGEPEAWRLGRPCEPVAGAWPLEHRVSRRSGNGWLLVGDAAGFLDPFTGEGIHRALVSARLAARAVQEGLAGDRSAMQAYDHAMRARFAVKDLVSWIVQSFLGRPSLFEYAARRLATRPHQRETMSLVMGDLVPARNALDPRFLAALLAP